MLVSAKLLSEKKDSLTYRFGPSSQNMDGVFHVNLNDLDSSFVEVSSKGIPLSWALRTIASISLVMKEKGYAPKTYVYCPGY